jgi:chromosome segregation ATPase
LKNTATGSGNVDMEALYEIFASKNPPDNTIIRITALEKLTKELGSKLEGANFSDLKKRLASLEEKVNSNHESRIGALEEALNHQNNRINSLSDEVNLKATKSSIENLSSLFDRHQTEFGLFKSKDF